MSIYAGKTCYEVFNCYSRDLCNGIDPIKEALSKEALANLMNNRPIASQQKYNKNVDIYNRYRNEVDNGIIQKVGQRLGREYTLEELERDRAEIARKIGSNPKIPLTDEEGVVYYEDLMSTHELKIANDVKRMELNDKTSFLELLNKGRESETEFKEVCNKLYNTILKGLGIKKEDLSITLRDGLKGNERIIFKTVKDYTGDFSRIFDVNGGTLTFKTIKESSQGWEIAKKYLGDKVANDKATVTRLGYKDFKINMKMDNGFIGEMIFIDEDMMWAKEKGLGHDIYIVERPLEEYVDETKEDYESNLKFFGEKIRNQISLLDDAICEWSTKYYDNSHDIRFGQYDMEGFRVNFRAVSSEITELVSQLRQNLSLSSGDGESSYTLPSEVDLNMDISQVEESLLNAVSQISKYLTDIKKASDTSNVTQEETEVKQVSDTTGVRYNKQVSSTTLESKSFTETEKRLREDSRNFDSEGNHLAPNGKKSNLNYRQWVQTRTQEFKKWFGDWEKAFRIKKLSQSETLVFNWNTDSPAYNLNPNSAKTFLQNNYQGKTFENDDTGEKYVLGKRGRQKLLSHSRNDTAYLKSLYYLPEIIKNSIFITETDSYKENGKYDRYRYLVCGINLDGVDYTVKSVFGLDSNGQWVYDQGLSEIEKGTLIGMLNKHVTQDSLQLKDSTLFSILQDDASIVVDENGEPRPVKHGTENVDFTAFDISKAGTTDAGWLGRGFYFYGNNSIYASQYAGRDGRVIDAFLNVKNPYYISDSEMSELAEKDNLEASTAFTKRLEEEGFDGVFYNGDLNEEWCVFNSNQIKSATNNIGTFDRKDPVIYNKTVDYDFELTEEEGSRYRKNVDKGDLDFTYYGSVLDSIAS